MIRIYQFIGLLLVSLGLGIYALNPAEVPGLITPIITLNLSMVLALVGLALLLLFSPVPNRENIERIGQTVRSIKDAIHGKDQRSE